VAEIKDKELNPDSKSDSENTGKGQIIDANPTVIVATTKIQPEEPTDPDEGEHLFHSQMWVKGTPLHFIVDSESQKNLISAEVVKQLGLSTTPHPQPYNIRWLRAQMKVSNWLVETELKFLPYEQIFGYPEIFEIFGSI
jgi:hypothetical protein